MTKNYFSREQREDRRAIRIDKLYSKVKQATVSVTASRGKVTSQNVGSKAIELVSGSLNSYRLPSKFNLGYSGIRRAMISSGTVDSAVVTVHAEFKTRTGVNLGIDIPVEIRNGELIEPSVFMHNGIPKIIAQSSFDEIVKDSTIFDYLPVRAMYSAPLPRGEAKTRGNDRIRHEKINTGMFNFHAARNEIRRAINLKTDLPINKQASEWLDGNGGAVDAREEAGQKHKATDFTKGGSHIASMMKSAALPKLTDFNPSDPKSVKLFTSFADQAAKMLRDGSVTNPKLVKYFGEVIATVNKAMSNVDNMQDTSEKLVGNLPPDGSPSPGGSVPPQDNLSADDIGANNEGIDQDSSLSKLSKKIAESPISVLKPWPESKIIDYMREAKNRRGLPEYDAVIECIADGCSGSYDSIAEGEEEYIRSLYRLATKNDEFEVDPAERESNKISVGHEYSINQEMEVKERGGVIHDIKKGTKCEIVKDVAGDGTLYHVKFDDGFEVIIDGKFVKKSAKTAERNQTVVDLERKIKDLCYKFEHKLVPGLTEDKFNMQLKLLTQQKDRVEAILGSEGVRQQTAAKSTILKPPKSPKSPPSTPKMPKIPKPPKPVSTPTLPKLVKAPAQPGRLCAKCNSAPCQCPNGRKKKAEEEKSAFTMPFPSYESIEPENTTESPANVATKLPVNKTQQMGTINENGERPVTDYTNMYIDNTGRVQYKESSRKAQTWGGITKKHMDKMFNVGKPETPYEDVLPVVPGQELQDEEGNDLPVLPGQDIGLQSKDLNSNTNKAISDDKIRDYFRNHIKDFGHEVNESAEDSVDTAIMFAMDDLFGGETMYSGEQSGDINAKLKQLYDEVITEMSYRQGSRRIAMMDPAKMSPDELAKNREAFSRRYEHIQAFLNEAYANQDPINAKWASRLLNRIMGIISSLSVNTSTVVGEEPAESISHDDDSGLPPEKPIS